VNDTMKKAALVWVAALAALSGCKKGDAIDHVVTKEPSTQGVDAPPAPSSDQDVVKMEVTVEKAEVALGDSIDFRVKLTNTGSTAAQVNRPRIDRQSVTIRVRRPDTTYGRVERIYATIGPRGLVMDAPEALKLDAGQSLEEKISTVAIEAGKLAYTLSYKRQGAPAPLTSPTFDVTVTPADAKAGRLGVKLETSHGNYTAVLRPDVAFDTVESFASLVKRGFYTGLKFHRILKNFMAQGGDPEGTGGGGPGYFLPLEANPAKLPHKRGVISMARTNHPDTAGSQFFLMFTTRKDLDQGRYTTFGEMVDGEDCLKRLEAVAADDDPAPPKEKVIIQRAMLVNVP
jgi:peptidyl-prolyl cis-trans isomerase B (cyclophilin B)